MPTLRQVLRHASRSRMTGGSAPSAPTLSTPTAGDAQVGLSWGAVAGAASYKAYRSDTSGSGYSLLDSGITGTTYTDDTAVNGETYYYVVTAVNGFGESGYSNEESAAPEESAGEGLIGAAFVQFDDDDLSPARITSAGGQVVELGDSITVTYCIIDAVSAYLDKRNGTTVALTCDGAQHTVTFTPTISGDFPIVATDSEGGVVVSPQPFVVQMPELAAIDPTASPTKTTVQDGPWSDTATWGGAVPTLDDIVSVEHEVTISTRAALAGRVIVEDGGIVNQNAVLVTTDLHVKDGGAYRKVVSGDGLSIDLLLNRPHHANDTSGNSPDGQANFWNAVYVASGGELTMDAVEPTHMVRVTADPQAGDTEIALAEPVENWRAGDRLFVPDSRALTASQMETNDTNGYQTYHHDVAVVRGVSEDGLTVYLLNPLEWTHPGATDLDGEEIADLKPHVVNLYRRSLFVTTDPTDISTRAHVKIEGRAHCDLQNGMFHGTGRTTLATFGGSNPNERFPLLLRNLYGPAPVSLGGPGPLDNDLQFRVKNCVVMDPLPIIPQPQVGWGISFHTTCYGEITDNVVINWTGSGIFQMDRNSNYIRINGNFVSMITGNGSRFGDGSPPSGQVDDGRHGMGIQISGPFNQVNDNVMNAIGNGRTNQLCVGLALITHQGGYGDTQRLPAFQGADPYVEGQYVLADCINVPFGLSQTGVGDCDNNETYGITDMSHEFWYINSRSNGPGTNYTKWSVFDGWKGWHCHAPQTMFPYYQSFVRIANGKFYSPLNKLVEGSASNWAINGDYNASHLQLVNCHFEGFTTVFIPTTSGTSTNIRDHSVTEIIGCTIRCKNTVFLGGREQAGGHMNSGFNIRRTVLRDNTYLSPSAQGNTVPHTIGLMIINNKDSTNDVAPDEFLIYGLGGKHYKGYWEEQLRDAIQLPTGTTDGRYHFWCPESGLTALEMYGKYTPPYIDPAGADDVNDGYSDVKPDAPNYATIGLMMKGFLAPASGLETNALFVNTTVNPGYVLPIGGDSLPTTFHHVASEVLHGSLPWQLANAVDVDGYETYQAVAAVNDEFQTPTFTLGGSTDVQVRVRGSAGTDRGIVTWSVYDDTDTLVDSFAAQDWYAASLAYNTEKTTDSLTLPAGTYYLRGKVAAKHASSSNYRMALSYMIVEEA